MLRFNSINVSNEYMCIVETEIVRDIIFNDTVGNCSSELPIGSTPIVGSK